MKQLLQRMSAVLAVASSILFISCEKSAESIPFSSNNAASVNAREYQYPIYNPSATEIGMFRIESSEKGTAVVVIQLNNAPGSTLAASIHNPQRNGADPLYIKLNDVNAEGYGRTENVADGTRALTAQQLANLIGFELQLRKGNTLFARGSIR